MPVHLIEDALLADLHAQRVERAFGELTQQVVRLLAQPVDGDRGPHPLPAAASVWRFQHRPERRELHRICPRVVLTVRGDDPLSLQRRQQLANRRPDDGNAIDAVAATAGDDEHLARASDLLLAQPTVRAANGCARSRLAFAKVENAIRTEAKLVPDAHASGRDVQLLVPGFAQRLGEARLVAGEATRATDAVAPDLLWIPCPVHSGVSERLEEAAF